MISSKMLNSNFGQIKVELKISNNPETKGIFKDFFLLFP
jgi:hypothetical protein